MTELPKNQAELQSLIEAVIAKRLIEKVEQSADITGAPTGKPASELAPREAEDVALPAEFAKVEKNLASLGFFTPSSKRIREAKAKTVSISTVVNGNRVEAKATIVPATLYGLPITADQDKYLALQKIITDLRTRQGGKVTNPISFTSAEILTLLHRYRDSGKNYREIDEWLNVMASTTIISEGSVYLAGKRRWVKDRFHVFDRAVSFGKELEEGVIADKNYVWLSEWQLENINSNHLIPVDLEAYRQLRNHIAKTLVPLLQIWLYASRKQGSFEKRYDELCQILSIRQYFQVSRIKEQLEPSLDELTQCGYLASWAIEKTADEKAYKMIVRHGEKFHRDRKRRLSRPSTASTPIQVDAVHPASAEAGRDTDPGLVQELTKRGIGESGAKRLLATLPPARPVRELLEWGDSEIARQPDKIQNPAGFYIRLLEEHSAPPPTFESSQAKETRHQANLKLQRAVRERQADARAAETEKRRLGERRMNTMTAEQRRLLLEQIEREVSTLPFMARHRDGSRIHSATVRARAVRQLADRPMELLAVPQTDQRVGSSEPWKTTIAVLLSAQRAHWHRLNQSVDQ